MPLPLISGAQEIPVEPKCTLIPGVFGLLVQGVLFGVCCLVLVVKHEREKATGDLHERSFSEFVFDSSKQIIGAGWIHVMNLGCAIVLGDYLHGDGCEWYWVNIMVDTTLGVAVEYLVLNVVTLIVQKIDKNPMHYRTGEYHDSCGTMQLVPYVKQLVLWLFVVTVMKVSMVSLVYVFADALSWTAELILQPFRTSAKTELVVVMILTPMVMNAIQFWLIDNFIKKGSHEKSEKNFMFMKPVVVAEGCDDILMAQTDNSLDEDLEYFLA